MGDPTKILSILPDLSKYVQQCINNEQTYKQTRFILYKKTDLRILLEGLKKTTKYFNQDRRGLDQDFNREPPKIQIKIVYGQRKLARLEPINTVTCTSDYYRRGLRW
jgi:hypothetical protein